MPSPYNESLVEGFAVLSSLTTTSLVTNSAQYCKPFHMGNLRRVVFDITVLASGNTTATCYVALLGATTAGATFYQLTGPDTTYPSLVTSSFTAGGTVTSTITTAVNIVRFEYKAESIKNAIDVYNSKTTSGGTKVGPWIKLGLNSATDGSATVAVNLVAYGIGANAPSADISINKWLTNTSVLVPVTNAYIDGWVVSTTSTTGNSPYTTPLLPY